MRGWRTSCTAPNEFKLISNKNKTQSSGRGREKIVETFAKHFFSCNFTFEQSKKCKRKKNFALRGGKSTHKTEPIG